MRVLARYRMRGDWVGLFAGTRAGMLQAGEDPSRWRVLLDHGGWRDATLVESRRGLLWVWVSLRLDERAPGIYAGGKRLSTLQAIIWRTAVKGALWRRLRVLAGAADARLVRAAARAKAAAEAAQAAARARTPEPPLMPSGVEPPQLRIPTVPPRRTPRANRSARASRGAE